MAKGIKTGGRVKGTPNRATKAREEIIARSRATPLEFLLDVMQDDEKPLDVRLFAAKAAAPYVHPRLSSTEVKGDITHRMAESISEEHARHIAQDFIESVRSGADAGSKEPRRLHPNLPT